MSDTESRLAGLEMRVAALEAAAGISGSHGSGAAPSASATDLVTIAIANKRFDPPNHAAGSFTAFIWFDCTYTLLRSSKPVRALKGHILFADLFNDPQFRLHITVNTPLSPGVPLPQPGTGFEFNEFMPEHQWLYATSLSDMRCSFVVSNVIYADGESHEFS